MGINERKGPGGLEGINASSRSTSKGVERVAETMRDLDRHIKSRSAELDKIDAAIAERQSRIAEMSSLMSRVVTTPMTPSFMKEMGVPEKHFGTLQRQNDVDRVAYGIRFVGGRMDKETARLQELEEQRDAEREKRRQIANRAFENRIASTTKQQELERDTRRISSQVEVFGEARSLAYQATDTDLAKGIKRNTRLQTETAQRVGELSGSINSPEGRQAFMDEATKLETLKQKGAVLFAAERYQRKIGLDLGSQAVSSEALGRQIIAGDSSARLENRVRSGDGIGSFSDETKKLNAAGSTFIDVLNKFNQELNATGDVSKELRDQLSAVTDQYKGQKDLVNEMQRQAKEGGGGDRFGMFRAGAGFANNMVQAAQFAFVSSNITDVANRTALAEFTNKRYFDQFAGTQGDMAALRRTTDGVYKRAVTNADELGNRSTLLKTAEAGVTTVDLGLLGVGGALKGVGGGGLLSMMKAPIGAAAGAGKELLTQGGPIVRSGIEAATDAASGLTANQARYNRAIGQVQVEDAINRIPDTLRQRFFDFNMGAFAQTAGMGGKAGGIFNTVTGAASRAALAGLGIAPDQQAALFGQAARDIGTPFINARDGGSGLINRAAEVQRSRITTAEDFLGRTAQMTAAGGSQGNIEEILANAVARGVDNAKAFGDMVNAVTSLSQSSAARGIENTIGVTQSMLRGMDTLGGSGLSEAMKIGAVSTGLRRSEDITSDIGLNFGTLKQVGQLAARLPGMSRAGLVMAAGVSGTQMQTLSKMLGDKNVNVDLLRTTALQTGAAELLFDEGGALRTDARDRLGVLRDTQIDKMVSRTMGITNAEQRKQLRAAADDPNIRLPTSLDQITYGDRFGFGTGGRAGLSSLAQTDISQAGLPGLGGGIASAQTIASAQAEGINKQIQDFTDIFKANTNDMITPLQDIAEKMKATAQTMSGLDSSTNTAEAAGQMKLDVDNFNSSVKEFNTAVNTLVSAMNNPRAIAQVTGAINSAVNKFSMTEPAFGLFSGSSNDENSTPGGTR